MLHGVVCVVCMLQCALHVCCSVCCMHVTVCVIVCVVVRVACCSVCCSVCRICVAVCVACVLQCVLSVTRLRNSHKLCPISDRSAVPGNSRVCLSGMPTPLQGLEVEAVFSFPRVGSSLCLGIDCKGWE